MQDRSQPHEGSNDKTLVPFTATFTSNSTEAPNSSNAITYDSTAGVAGLYLDHALSMISSSSPRCAPPSLSSGSSSPTPSTSNNDFDNRPLMELDFTPEELHEALEHIPSYVFSVSPDYDLIRADEYQQSILDQPTSKLSLQSWKELAANLEKLINACAASGKLPRPKTFDKYAQKIVNRAKETQQSVKDKRKFADTLRDERDYFADGCDAPSRLWISMLEMEVFGTRIVKLTRDEEEVLKDMLKERGKAHGIPMEVWDNLRKKMGVAAA